MAGPVRVGLIGYGLAGSLFHAPFIAAVEGLQLAAVATSRRDEVAARHPGVRVVPGPREIIDDPSIELVVVAAPTDRHFELARVALSQGKHLVVDKPLTSTWSEARSLAALAAGSGLVLSTFHNRRYDSDFRTVQRLLAEGRIGRPTLLEARWDRYRPIIKDRWREQPGPGSGLWLDLGSHLVDQALRLFGVPHRLTAHIDAMREGARVDDDFLVTLAYPGLRVILRAASLVPIDTPRFVLMGEAGAFVKYGLDPQEEALARGERPGGPGWGRDPSPGVLTAAGTDVETTIEGEPGDYRLYYADVARAVRGEGPAPVPPAEALAVMAILEIARDSADQGVSLDVASDPRMTARLPDA